ncbi:MAG: SBBP repeat-containing protein [Bryobacteraceae bacterium]
MRRRIAAVPVFLMLAASVAAAQSRALPLMFEPNVGQANVAAEFVAHTPQCAAQFDRRGITLRRGDDAIRIAFGNASPATRISGVEPTGGRANYFVGSNANWITGIPLYRGVRYAEVYPGIGVDFHSPDSSLQEAGDLEYDFLVRPGARVAAIRLAFSGIQAMHLDRGDLILKTAHGEFRHRHPRIYREKNGKRLEIAGGFVLRGRNEVGFETAPGWADSALVIDPVLTYSTYVGGSSNTMAWAVAVDSTGSAYLAGETLPVNFGATFHVSDSTSSTDAFLVKMNSAGTAVVYADYFGGAQRSSARGVAVDSGGNAYVTGFAYSSDFPTTSSAYRSPSLGMADAFVMKLNPAGAALVYSALIGGAGNDFATGIAIDTSGNAYVSGYTTSLAFPVTNAFQPSYGGGVQDAFVAKLNSAGSALLYATYLGGTGNDVASGVAVDSLGYAYVAGYTDSLNFPTANALYASPAGQGDAFVTKLTPSGSGLVFSTYLGGSQVDMASAIAIDSSDNVFVTGTTLSIDFPATAGAFQTSNNGSYDAFVAELNSQGSALVYSTYVGGEGSDQATAIAVGGNDVAYIAGFTYSLHFPVQSAVQSSPGGAQDAFAAAIAAGGGSLTLATYLGGAGNDQANGIAIDSSGGVYIAGSSLSSNFPTTGGAFRTTYTAESGFLAKLSTGVQTPSAVSVSPSSGSGLSQTFTSVFSDTGGAGDLHQQFVLFNSSTSTTNACEVEYDGTNLYLLNNSGGAWLGPMAPGSSSSLSNSQCTLSGSGSSVSASGTTLTLTFAITFNSSFAGAKNTYLETTTLEGLNTGWQSRGTWTIPSYSAGTPSAVSVSPSSGNGLTQTFTFVFSDTGGAGDLHQQYALFNSSSSTTNACEVEYDGSNLYLLNNAGASWSGPMAPGSSSSLSNSQCTLGGSGSSASASGNTLTLTLPLTFASSFAGSDNTYMETTTQEGVNTGLVARGTWTVPGTPTWSAGTPSAVSVSPSSGSGMNQTFTFVFSDTGGAGDLHLEFILFSTSPGAAYSCEPQYDGQNLYLLNDAGSSWLGPMAPGSSSSLSNSQCTVSGSASSAALSGTTLTLNLAITFNSSFAGAKNIYMQTYTREGVNSDMLVRGSWTVAAPAGGTPSAVSVSPSSGSGMTQAFTFVFSDTGGAGDLHQQFVLFNPSTSTTNACEVEYDGSNLYLLNNAGASWLGPMTPGSSGSVSNSQCTLSGSGSSASPSGNTLTLALAITFNSSFAGSENVYMETTTQEGSNTGLLARGTWTVPSYVAGTPSAVSVSPSAGSGMSQTFTFVFSDTGGAGDLHQQFVLFNSSTSTTNACEVEYDGTNLYLLNNSGATWLGPMAPGSSGSLSNSQCTLGGSGSSASPSGNSMDLVLPITFSSSIASSENVYMETTTQEGVDTGLLERGTWTIPGTPSSSAGTPSVVSVSPSSGSGMSQTFTFTFSDTGGAGDLHLEFLLFSTSQGAAYACEPQYDGRNLYLLNDQGSNWLGPMAPGSSSSLSNSQCTVSGSGSWVFLSGTALNVNLAITFNSSFAGAKNIYMQSYTYEGLNTGMLTRGAWTVP